MLDCSACHLQILAASGYSFAMTPSTLNGASCLCHDDGFATGKGPPAHVALQNRAKSARTMRGLQVGRRSAVCRWACPCRPAHGSAACSAGVTTASGRCRYLMFASCSTVCPSPRSRNLVVIRPSTPTGPRAWMRAVEMPTSAPKPYLRTPHEPLDINADPDLEVRVGTNVDACERGVAGLCTCAGAAHSVCD